jgi:hypothetical protein
MQVKSKGTIRIFLGLFFILGAAGGAETSVGSIIPYVLLGIVGLAFLSSGSLAMDDYLNDKGEFTLGE